MQFIYVDESGDPGVMRSDGRRGASAHFILSSVRVSEAHWLGTLSAFADVRRRILESHHLPAWTEIHAREIVHPRNASPFRGLRNRKARIALLRELLETLADSLVHIEIASVLVNKPNHGEPLNAYDAAWAALLGFWNRELLSDDPEQRGIVLADETNESRLRRLVRRLRRGMSIGSRGVDSSDPMSQLVEDPVLRESHHSFLIQLADLTAYTLYLRQCPRGALRRYNGHELYELLQPRLSIRIVSSIPGTIVAE
jgi:Protein of unknown function (DUF3800)